MFQTKTTNTNRHTREICAYTRSVNEQGVCEEDNSPRDEASKKR